MLDVSLRPVSANARHPMSRSWAAASSAARSPRSWPRTARACGSTSATSSPRAPPGATPACSSTRWTRRSSASSPPRRRSTRELGHGFELPAEPVGVLVVSEDPAALEPTRADLAARFPELRAEALDPGALRDAEPALAEGLAAFRLAHRPARAARRRHPGVRRAGARRGRRAARGRRGHAARGRDGRATGVRTAAGTEPAGAVVVAAGPWTVRARRPDGRAGGRSRRSWGVNVELRLAQPPRHALEEGGIEDAAARRRRASARSSASSRATASPRSARRSSPSSPSRPRSRPRCSSAARASCPRWAAPTSSPCAPARGR